RQFPDCGGRDTDWISAFPLRWLGETCRDGSVHVPSKPGAINGISPEQVKFLNNQIMKLQRTSQTIFKE
ncbi:MAG: hypothetical protein P8Y40_05785, partial [Desulfobacterales bacterium]